MSSDLIERLLERVEKTDGCWLWRGSTTSGYGQVMIDYKGYRVHRLVYELLVGPIPEGLVLDHTCHNVDDSCPGGKSCLHRRCVNPDHLEPVTNRENTVRGNRLKGKCGSGHLLIGDNLFIDKNGWQRCRACAVKRTSKWYRKRKSALLDSLADGETK